VRSFFQYFSFFIGFFVALISLTNGYLSFSDAPLLDHAELHIEPNERVCLVGRNGAGKSTLLKIIAGDVIMDDGKVQYEKDLVVSRLEQDPPRHAEGNVFDYVAEGIEHLADLLKEYHHISMQLEQDYSEQTLNQLAQIQAKLEHANGWQFENKINEVLQKLELNPAGKFPDGIWREHCVYFSRPFFHSQNGNPHRGFRSRQIGVLPRQLRFIPYRKRRKLAGRSVTK